MARRTRKEKITELAKEYCKKMGYQFIEANNYQFDYYNEKGDLCSFGATNFYALQLSLKEDEQKRGVV